MPKKKTGVTYADAGVDIGAGAKAVDLIKVRAEQTFRHFKDGEILTGIGGFSALVKLPDGRIMAASTDGVGTKLILAILLGKHGSVGVDLVAMCVNDIAVCGISPAFFLDYIAMGKQIPERTSEIVGGIIYGCELAEAALIGGEMAELPGMYKEDDYDLAGFAIGLAESQGKLILGDRIRPGMNVYGVASSGVHSNGFSLIRRVFEIKDSEPEKARKILNRYYKTLGCTLGEELLKPTEIYVRLIKQMRNRYDVAGLVHITGGGLVDNPPRILPEGCSMKIRIRAWKRPPIFRLIRKRGGVNQMEMFRTFNCGLGLLVISPDKVYEGEKIGEIVPGDGEVIFV